MQGNRSRDTKPELAVRSAVHRRGLRYRVAARPLPELRRTADLVFRKAKIAVFVDGCYWHGCPEHHTQPTIPRRLGKLVVEFEALGFGGEVVSSFFPSCIISALVAE